MESPTEPSRLRSGDVAAGDTVDIVVTRSEHDDVIAQELVWMCLEVTASALTLSSEHRTSRHKSIRESVDSKDWATYQLARATLPLTYGMSYVMSLTHKFVVPLGVSLK